MFVTVWVTMEQDIYGIIHNVRILVNHYDHNNSTHNTVMSSSPGPVSPLRMLRPGSSVRDQIVRSTHGPAISRPIESFNELSNHSVIIVLSEGSHHHHVVDKICVTLVNLHTDTRRAQEKSHRV